MSNPSKVTWTNPITRTDGKSYAAAETSHYLMSIDGSAPFQVPSPDGKSVHLTAIAQFKALAAGEHHLQIGVVAKDGTVSDLSAPQTFTVVARPQAPAGVQIS